MPPSSAFLNPAIICSSPIPHKEQSLCSSFPFRGKSVSTMPWRLSRARPKQISASLNETFQPSSATTFASLFPNVDDALVQTTTGESTSLLSYVQEQNAAGNAVLLGWLRHYGCTLCKKQAVEWRDWSSELQAITKLSIALIGNGPVSHAIDFKDEVKWNATLFTDPSRTTYSVLEFRKDQAALFNLPSLSKAIKSFAAGNSQTWTRIPTDPFQQGGALLVNSNGVVSFFHADQFSGDHVDKAILLDAVRSTIASTLP